MGWNDVSYNGSEIQTPTIDKLAREGVELNRFYVHPACSPTRSSIMTGKAAVRLGFVNPLGVDDPLWKVLVDPDIFGGKIDRAPYARKEGKIAGPLHHSFYILGIIVLVLFSLIFFLLKKIIKTIFRKSKNQKKII